MSRHGPGDPAWDHEVDRLMASLWLQVNDGPPPSKTTNKKTTEGATVAITQEKFDKLDDKEKYFTDSTGVDRCGVCKRPQVMTEQERTDIKNERQSAQDKAEAKERERKNEEDRVKVQDAYDNYLDACDLVASYVTGLRWALFFGIVAFGVTAAAGLLSILGDWFQGLYVTGFIVGPVGMVVTLICTVSWVIGHQDGKDSPKHKSAKAKRAYNRLCAETGQVGISLG